MRGKISNSVHYAESRSNPKKTAIGIVAMRSYAVAKSRKGLVDRLVADDKRVFIGAAVDSSAASLNGRSIQHQDIPFPQGGLKSGKDIRAAWKLARWFRHERIEYVHAIGMKPVLLTGVFMSLGIAPLRGAIATVTGLGTHRQTIKSRIMRPFLRFSLRQFTRIVFQNSDDFNMFRRHGLASMEQARLIVGSGVDIHEFSPKRPKRPGSEGTAPLRVVMISRLLKSKGIETFGRVARTVKRLDPSVEFHLYGSHDESHPDALPLEVLEGLESLTYMGRSNNVPDTLSACDVFLFPSTYGEGVPRVVMEAAAMGVPCVAFDVPGVREAICDGITGFLVPEGQERIMTRKIVEVLQDPDLRKTMGSQARRMAERHFDIHRITEQYMEEYGAVGLIDAPKSQGEHGNSSHG